MFNTPNRVIQAAGFACLLTVFFLPSVAAEIQSGFKTADEILVTAKTDRKLAEVLATSHVLDAAEIRAAQAIDLPDLLDQISGLNTTPTGGRGSVTGVFVRGTSIAQNIVLIDGVRVGSATLGQAALNTYPLDAIERIEVVKGPLAAIYGADAVGGVIQIFSRKAVPGRGTATVTMGSDSLLEYGLTLGVSNQRNSLVMSAHAEQTDGIDHTSILSDGNDDRDGFDESSFSLVAETQLGAASSAGFSILYTDNESQFDNTFGADSGFVTTNRTLNMAVNITTKLADSVKWVTTLGANEDESITDVFASDITSNRASAATEFAFMLGDATELTVGADYYREDIESLSEFPVTDRDNTGAFALLQSTLGKFSLLGSMRYDDNSAYGGETNGSIAADYDFSDDLRIVLSFGTAFAAPSFNFLYFPFFGNPDLLPEESESLEISLMGNNHNLDWRISAFQTDIKNLFSFDPNTFLAANIGAAEFRGLEMEIASEIADWLIRANIDLLSARDTDTNLKLDDRVQTSLNISAARNFDRLNLRFDIRAEDGRHDNGGTELSGYALFDLSSSYQLNDRLSVSAKIANLFDKDYTLNLLGFTERYNTLGRQGRLTVRYQF
ncbi:MAG: TonB-dependent receptor [Gammaproteobacteria bacterium]|nr:TonB-dependent receptor [Gammaproteobacteria bacterium]